MQRALLTFSSIGLAFVLLFSSCNKGPSFGPLEGDGLDDLFLANRTAATQSFQVSASTGGTITGSGGVRVTFPPNAFRTPTGSSVSGTVQVSLLEVLTIGDMIRLNAQTVGNDHGILRVLSSGGAVHVQAMQGGTTLKLGPLGMEVTVLADVIDPNMRVFTTNTTTADGLIWQPADSLAIDSSMIEWPSGWSPAYQLQVDSMQWINCDFFPYSTNNTDVSATTPADVPNDSTQIWLVFPSLNAVTIMGFVTDHMYSFGTVPVGEQAIVVGLTRDGDDYRSAFTSVTTAQGLTAGLSFQPTTLQAFEAAVDNL